MNRSQFAEKHGTILWDGYTSVYDAIDEGERRLLIRSCNGAGKTHLLASLIAYELENAPKYEDGTPLSSLAVICTGATATQLKNVLWAETKRYVKKVGTNVDKAGMRLVKNDSQYAIAINPGKVESGQGYHADRVVVIADEATGMPKDLLMGLFSNASTMDSLIICTYNPIDSDSAIFELEEADPSWKKFSISAFDHPNVITGQNAIPGAVSRDSVERWLRMDSLEVPPTMPEAIEVPWLNKFYYPTPEALARVCGKWSIAQSHGFINMREIIDCCNEKHEVTQEGMRCIGVDVAAMGDDKTVIATFFGDRQMAYEKISTQDHSITTAFIENIILQNKIELVTIDDTGIGNAITIRLKQSKYADHFILIPVNFAAKPKGFERDRSPLNARAEMYMVLETEIRKKQIALIYDTHALKEIGAARIVPMKGSTHVRLEDKAIIKRRLGRSPDHADATALARYGRKLIHYHNRPALF